MSKLNPRILLLVGTALLFLFGMAEINKFAIPFTGSMIIFFGGLALVLLALSIYSIGIYGRWRSKRLT